MNTTKGIDKGIVLLIFIALTAVATAVFLYLQVRSDKITDAVQAKSPINVLFVLHDDNKAIFSEVLMYNPVTYGGAILDIPGDLGLIIESLNKFDRIDVLYKKGNPKAFREKAASFSGIPIPFYIEMSLDEIEHVVDLVDGLDVFIANPVEATDREPPVLLPQGSVLLDGRKIRSLLTYNDPGESRADAIGRRQKFLQSLIKTMGQKSKYLLSSSVFRILAGNMTTNLDNRALRSFLKELYRIDTERILFHQVLGTEREVDNQNLLFPHFDGELFRSRVQQIVESLASTETSDDSENSVTIQILNGTVIGGFASRTESLFQSFGYNEVIIGNADKTDYQNTVVIDRRGNVANAQKVADIIKCSKVESISDDTLDGRIDVTIILGKDFDGRYCK